ncbi:phospholipid scramblase 2 [Biomphalaria glabrata]|uniref:Phospholipid scramblase n=1 Tax=Biomphalaria glabrata TaxID=6526 RepID=A0A9W2ZJS1_BIOGL|nr:phospholipid scramblase 2-like [Biomphalaria glabrata]KAI8766445.1 phospholipid scramblase 2-like [Biomphalaria glabrata]
MPKLDQNQLKSLSVFANLDHVIVKQKVELLEAIVGFETKNKYIALDEVGRQLFSIGEESSCCFRQLCSSGRAYTMHVHDVNMSEVMIIQSPMRPCIGPLCFACCDLCSHQNHVFCCQKEIGYIKEELTFVWYNFVVYKSDDMPAYTIKAPLCRWDSCCCEDVFQIYEYQGNVPIGKISKSFSGLAKEVFTDADLLGVQFPKEMHVRDKALLFAAVFLIDLMFYENNKNDPR